MSRASGAVAVALAGALVALAFLTSSSSDPGVPVAATATWSEIAILVLGALACGAVAVVGGRGRAWGAVAVALMAAFAAFAALSILWAVQPDWSWFGANQLLAYLAAFAGGAAAARLWPGRWAGVVCGLALAAVALCLWALLAKVFPATLAPSNTYGRLQAPFGYWNAVGATAAFGLPLCMWSATAPSLPRAIRAGSVPALTVLIAVVVLSYSRSATAAGVIGAALLVAIVPGRLQTLAGLALGAAGAIPILVWALDRPALSSDHIAAAAQDAAGHSFGVVLVIVLAVMLAAGFAFAIATERVALGDAARRRIGTALVVLAALVPLMGVAALASSSRGLTGEISHAWHSLTSSSSGVGNGVGRITQLGSSRPLYWHQGLRVGESALLGGVGELGYGIARLRFTHDAAKSDHAHSYLVQTFADLGLIGLALTLALLVAWALAARRTLEPDVGWRSLEPTAAAERAGLVALLGAVLAFGIQSALDWTTSFAGVAVPALIAAGWLAGRGPLSSPVGTRHERSRLRDRPGLAALLTAAAAVVLACAWLMWQPLRSAQELAASLNADTAAAAFGDARAGAAADPLSYQPLLRLSALYGGLARTAQARGEHASATRLGAQARAEVLAATRLTPQDPEPWVWLGDLDLAQGRRQQAIADMQRVQALDHTPDPWTEEAARVIAAAGQ